MLRLRTRWPSLVLAALASAPLAATPPSPSQRAAAYVDRLQRSSGTPALSAAVAWHGAIVFSHGAGFADVENRVPATGSTVYNIGSVSKAVTAVAVMQLVEQGRIGLDDDVRKYVPAFPDKGAPITLRRLLTHTSGIRHYLPADFPNTPDNENTKPFRSFAEALALFKDDPLLFKPGAYYFYSSYAVNLLQGVIESVTGLSFEESLRRSVWQPAGMASTSVDVPERAVPNRAQSYRFAPGDKRHPIAYYYNDLTYKFPSGGMISSADDLVRLAIALHHGTLMKPATVATMFHPQLDPVLTFRERGRPLRQSFQQAILWRVQRDAAGHRFVYHCGSVKAFNACLLDYPDEDLAVSLLTNSWGEAGGYKQAEAIANLLRRKNAVEGRVGPATHPLRPQPSSSSAPGSR